MLWNFLLKGHGIDTHSGIITCSVVVGLLNRRITCCSHLIVFPDPAVSIVYHWINKSREFINNAGIGNELIWRKWLPTLHIEGVSTYWKKWLHSSCLNLAMGPHSLITLHKEPLLHWVLIFIISLQWCSVHEKTLWEDRKLLEVMTYFDANNLEL